MTKSKKTATPFMVKGGKSFATGYDFLNALEIIARATLKHAGAKVTSLRIKMSGVTASTSWQGTPSTGLSIVINMPVIDASAKIPRQTALYWIGYLVHEIAHNLITDASVWQEACRKGIAGLVNTLEDPRIELWLQSASVAMNSFDLLEALAEYLQGKSMEPVQGAPEYNPNDPESLQWTMVQMSLYELCGYRGETLNATRAKIKPDNWKWLQDNVFTGILAAKNTQDILELALKLNQDMQAKQDTQESGAGKPSKSGKAGEAGEAGTSGSGTGKAGKAGEAGEAGTSGSGTGKAGEAGETGKPETGTSGKPETSQRKGAPTPGGMGVADFDQNASASMRGLNAGTSDPRAPDQTLESLVQAAKDAGDSYAGERLSSLWNPGKGFRPSGAVSIYGDMKRKIKRVARVRATLRRLVSAPGKTDYKRLLPRGRFDTRRFGNLITQGRTDIFKRRIDTAGIDTAVAILIDGSSSMAGQNISGETLSEMAGCLALQIGETVESMGQPISIHGFTNARSGKVNLHAIKESQERMSKVKAHVSGLATFAQGGTPMAPAIVALANQFRHVRAERKIMFVLTDGDCGCGVQAMKMAQRIAFEMDIEVIGLGCLCDCSHAFYVSANCLSFDDIVTDGLATLANTLKTKIAA